MTGRKKMGDTFYTHPKQSIPSFFKIYLPEHNSHKLLIPPDFMDHFNGIIPEKVKLKNIHGKIWSVSSEVDEKRVFITVGWDEYVRDHSLVRGDFLVFNHLQHSVFFVQAFGINGCIKEEPFHKGVRTRPASRTKGKSPGQAVASSVKKRNACAVEYRHFYKTFRTNFKNFVGVPKHVLKTCSYRLPQDIILRNNKGDFLETHLRETNDRIVIGYAGLSDFWRKCQVECGDKLEFKAILGRTRKIKEFCVEVLHRKKHIPFTNL